MIKCVNIKSPEFVALHKEVGGSVNVLKSKIGVWQTKNNTDEFPSLETVRELMKPPKEIVKHDELEKLKSKPEFQQAVKEAFEESKELQNAVYSALGFNTINGSEITYTDEEGNPCAKMGLTNTTKGTGWKIVKDFKGQPKHSNGGVDITISDKGVTMRRGGKDIKAKYGLIIINNN